jgi:hypothetical protein
MLIYTPPFRGTGRLPKESRKHVVMIEIAQDACMHIVSSWDGMKVISLDSFEKNGPSP